MGFVSQLISQESEELRRCFVPVSCRAELLHETVSDYGTIDLDAHCVLRRSPELLGFEALLYPFEEQFDIPPTPIQLRNRKGGCLKIVS